jgi:hypothetical protein
LVNPDPYLFENVTVYPSPVFFNPKSSLMEKMHSSFSAKESTILTIITAVLYFCAIMSFAYVFTMSN